MTVTRPGARPDQRDCALYRIYVLDPRTNYTTVTLGYIGETARLPFVRFLEHLYEQPFGDTIVGAPHVDPRVFAGKDAVWAAERAAVEAERPLYNFEWNLANPDRIPIPEARRQRAARDAARGVRPWTPSSKTPRGQVTPSRRNAVVTRPGRTLSPVWRRRRNTVAIRAGVWLALSSLLTVAALRWLALLPDVSAGPAGLVSAAGMAYTAPWWRRRRGWRKATCRSVGVALAVSAVVVLASAHR